MTDFGALSICHIILIPCLVRLSFCQCITFIITVLFEYLWVVSVHIRSCDVTGV